MANVKKEFNQREDLVSSGQPAGSINFEKQTGRIIVGQDDGSNLEYGIGRVVITSDELTSKQLSEKNINLLFNNHLAQWSAGVVNGYSSLMVFLNLPGVDFIRSLVPVSVTAYSQTQLLLSGTYMNMVSSDLVYQHILVSVQSDGTIQIANPLTFNDNGDGTKVLADNGQYVDLPSGSNDIYVDISLLFVQNSGTSTSTQSYKLFKALYNLFEQYLETQDISKCPKVFGYYPAQLTEVPSVVGMGPIPITIEMLSVAHNKLNTGDAVDGWIVDFMYSATILHEDQVSTLLQPGLYKCTFHYEGLDDDSDIDCSTTVGYFAPNMGGTGTVESKVLSQKGTWVNMPQTVNPRPYIIYNYSAISGNTVNLQDSYRMTGSSNSITTAYVISKMAALVRNNISNDAYIPDIYVWANPSTAQQIFQQSFTNFCLFKIEFNLAGCSTLLGTDTISSNDSTVNFRYTVTPMFTWQKVNGLSSMVFTGVTGSIGLDYITLTILGSSPMSVQLLRNDLNTDWYLAGNGDYAKLPSVTVDSILNKTSTNPVQNKVITAALEGKGDIIIIDQDEYMNGPISSTHLNALKSGGKMLYVRIPAGEVGGAMYMSIMPCAYIYNTTALYISRLEPISGGTRFFMNLYNKDTGVLEESHSVVLKSDGDGTKALMDDGTYKAIPTAPKIVIGRGLGQGVVSPVQGYRFSKSGLITANPAVGDTLINYDDGLLLIGEIIRVEVSYIYIGTDVINILH